LNRRGFSPSVRCGSCGKITRCPHCSVSLTFHKRAGARMRCHYCEYDAPLATRCPHCGAAALVLEGLGTERLEDTLAEAFPGARVARLDRDVGSGKRGQKILERMYDGVDVQKLSRQGWKEYLRQVQVILDSLNTAHGSGKIWWNHFLVFATTSASCLYVCLNKIPRHSAPKPFPTCWANDMMRASVFPAPRLPCIIHSKSGHSRKAICDADCGVHPISCSSANGLIPSWVSFQII
jgi:hypothetical protein